jgi:hypothetical protein
VINLEVENFVNFQFQIFAMLVLANPIPNCSFNSHLNVEGTVYVEYNFQ